MRFCTSFPARRCAGDPFPNHLATEPLGVYMTDSPPNNCSIAVVAPLALKVESGGPRPTQGNCFWPPLR